MTTGSGHPERVSFGAMAPIPYRDSFDDAEYARIARGLVPRTMEDKWAARLDGDCLRWHRSWTGRGVYQVLFQSSAGRHAVVEASCATEVLAGSGADDQAELLNFLVRNILLGERRPFPRPARLVEPLPGLHQHNFSGAGHPERTITRKP